MCSNNESLRKRWMGRAALPLVILALPALPISLQAAVAPGCTGSECQCDTVACGIQFNNATSGQIITPGSTVVSGTQVRVTALIGVLSCLNPGDTPCPFHHAALVITHPDGFVETLTTDLPLASSPPLSFTSTHVDDLNSSGDKAWHLTYGNPSNPLADAADGSWCTPNSASGETLGASTTCDQGLKVTSPKICVTKECVFPAGQTCFNFGQPISIRATIQNCGDENLVAISLTESRAGRPKP